ncbi:MAG: hypothetical protein ACOZEN_08785 [Thermodesulfobacteriota bacterium]
MRARNIKPGFYENEDLGECSIAARLIFPGLWMMCDRAGRLECRPKRIKAKLLPYDSIEVEPLLEELESRGLIRTYEVDGQHFIWVPGFTKHQIPHHREKASELPPHPLDDGEAQGKPRASLGQDEDKPENGKCQPPLNPESCILNPESPPSGDAREGVQENPDGIETQPHGVSLEIQQIGEGYPVHRYDPGAAEVAMKALAKARQWPGLTRVLADLAKRLESDAWTKDGGKCVPKLSRYIRDRMWLDPVPEAPQEVHGPPLPTGMTDAEYLRRKAEAERQQAAQPPPQPRPKYPRWKPGVSLEQAQAKMEEAAHG